MLKLIKSYVKIAHTMGENIRSFSLSIDLNKLKRVDNFYFLKSKKNAIVFFFCS